MKKRQKKNASVDRLTISRQVASSTSLQNRNDNSMPIPIDLIVLIFVKLPLKSIARCRCVSKLWASILCGSDFTELFLSRSCSRTPQILFAYQQYFELFFFSSPQPQNPDSNLPPVVPSYLLKIPCEDSFYEKTCDQVNGLICVANSWMEKTMFIKVCNPSTGQAFVLPKVAARMYCLWSLFGYDPIGKEYKVLIMKKSGKNAVRCDKYQVLTLKSGNLSWRMIECCIPHHPPTGKICINGVIYFTSLDWATESCFIVCFDVRFEKFSVIKITEVINRAIFHGNAIKLINYRGKLALLQEDRGFDGSTLSYKLWVLEDYEKQVWSDHTFLFPNVPEDIFGEGNLIFVGVTQTNEIVFSTRFSDNPFYLFYLNLEKTSIVRVAVQGMEATNKGRYYTFLDHVEDVRLY